MHDLSRPQPRAVTPGGAGTHGPPSDAVVLFDGTDLSQWESCNGGDAPWKVVGGFMEVVPGTGGIRTREHFGSCQLHLEWASPRVVRGDSQGRGNSGIFLLGLYEVQVLDSFRNPTYADGTAGAIYGQHPPRVNACRRPGEWQDWDIVFESPSFSGDRLVEPAYATVLLNNIVLHNRVELIGSTQNKQLAVYEPHPATGPLELQNHKNPILFRNIWIRPLMGYDE